MLLSIMCHGTKLKTFCLFYSSVLAVVNQCEKVVCFLDLSIESNLKEIEKIKGD